MKFKKNVISNLILQVLTIVIGFVTSILIARGLGAEKQGAFSYILLIFGLVASYGHLSISSSNGYFIKKSGYSKEKILNTNISVLIILSVIYMIILLFFKNSIFDSNYYAFSTIWFCYAISLIFTGFLTTVYVVDENVYIYNRFMVYINIFKGILIVLLFCLNCLNIMSVSIVYSIIEIIKLIIITINLKVKYKFEILWNILKKEFKYGFPLYMAALLIYLNYRADLFMVKNILGDTDLGVYSIAVHLAELAFIFPTALITAFEGRLYTCEDKERKSVTAQTVRLSFYITLIVCVIGMMCKPLITVLYGSEYVRSGLAMIFLLIGIIFASIGKVAPTYYYTMGKPNIHLVVSFLVLIINIIFNYFLIPIYGINGAAIASSVSYTFYGIIYVIMLKRSGISVKDLFKIEKKDIKKLKEQFWLRKRKSI